MPDPIRRFEILVLRPIHAILALCCFVLLFKGHWLWASACALGWFFLGFIGASMHPLQSASDLAEGPLENPTADFESQIFTDQFKALIVGRTCTKVSMFLSVFLCLVLLFAAGIRWYFALPISWVSLVFIGGFLKFSFKAS